MDYRIEYVDLPCKVKALTALEDDFCTILVNLQHSYYEQQKAIQHELEHISKGDFEKCDVNEIELDMEG